MSSNINSIIGRIGASLEETSESLGVTQFPSATSWYQIIGGLQVQGGFETLAGAGANVVPFSAPYEKQVLGIFIQVIGAAENGAFISAIGLNQFTLNNGAGARTYYWWAVGV
jgi:hypothetical protein